MAPFVPLRERWPVPRLAPTLLLLLLALAGLGAGIGTAVAVAQEPTPPPAPVTTAPQPSEGVRVSGSLNNAGQRLGGVTVRARDTTGAEVAEATSAREGLAE